MVAVDAGPGVGVLVDGVSSRREAGQALAAGRCSVRNFPWLGRLAGSSSTGSPKKSGLMRVWVTG